MAASTRIFTGHELAARLNAETRAGAVALARPPRCVVLVDPASAPMRAYAERQRALAAKAGIALEVEPYAGDADAVRRQVAQLAATAGVDAVAPLLPLPHGLDPVEVALLIGRDKDVDGLHPDNAGRLALGAPARMPATARACLLAARALLPELKGIETVIVGASRIVGRPLAQMLLDAEATVTVCHEATRNLADHTSDADLLVAAAGVPGLIGAAHVKPGAVVIDVSIVRVGELLVGDVDRQKVEGIAAVLTHVPDGVGPVTTACLFASVLEAARSGS